MSFRQKCNFASETFSRFAIHLIVNVKANILLLFIYSLHLWQMALVITSLKLTSGVLMLSHLCATHLLPLTTLKENANNGPRCYRLYTSASQPFLYSIIVSAYFMFPVYVQYNPLLFGTLCWSLSELCSFFEAAKAVLRLLALLKWSLFSQLTTE